MRFATMCARRQLHRAGDRACCWRQSAARGARLLRYYWFRQADVVVPAGRRAGGARAWRLTCSHVAVRWARLAVAAATLACAAHLMRDRRRSLAQNPYPPAREPDGRSPTPGWTRASGFAARAARRGVPHPAARPSRSSGTPSGPTWSTGKTCRRTPRAWSSGGAAARTCFPRSKDADGPQGARLAGPVGRDARAGRRHALRRRLRRRPQRSAAGSARSVRPQRRRDRTAATSIYAVYETGDATRRRERVPP